MSRFVSECRPHAKENLPICHGSFGVFKCGGLRRFAKWVAPDFRITYKLLSGRSGASQARLVSKENVHSELVAGLGLPGAAAHQVVGRCWPR